MFDNKRVTKENKKFKETKAKKSTVVTEDNEKKAFTKKMFLFNVSGVTTNTDELFASIVVAPNIVKATSAVRAFDKTCNVMEASIMFPAVDGVDQGVISLQKVGD